jgi:hypothetical protein
MEARENRFKKLRKLGRTEGESYFDDMLQESQNEAREINKAPTTKPEEPSRTSQTDAFLDKFKFESKPKRAPGFLREMSSEGKNTTDSDEHNSPLESGGSTGRSRLNRLKKILNPSETKESFEEEEIKDEPECPICLNKIEKDSARINCCNHIFCFDCIREWTDVANQCPLCKKRISRIQKFSGGQKVNEVRIKFKEQEFQEPEFETIESKKSLILFILSQFRY